MRDIEFRAKWKSDNPERDGRWVYGFYVRALHGETRELTDFILESDAMVRVVHGETVGEYTGLLDKNGVKIFGGDIVKGRSDNHIIGHEDCSFVITTVASTLSLILSPGLLEKNPMEVIGNIHDNPELLERKNAGN